MSLQLPNLYDTHNGSLSLQLVDFLTNQNAKT